MVYVTQSTNLSSGESFGTDKIKTNKKQQLYSKPKTQLLYYFNI